MAITCLAKSGKFSSDRAIEELCSDFWDIKPVEIPNPSQKAPFNVEPFSKKQIDESYDVLE